MNQHAYILGPMTGLPDDNRPQFKRMATRLREAGYRVTSPDELDTIDPVPDSKKNWVGYMRRDIPHLVTCDLAFALPGWQGSRGARLEATICKELGIPVYEVQETDKGFLIPTVASDRLPSVSMPPVMPARS